MSETIRITPDSVMRYSSSDTISNSDNAKTDVDSSTYATVTGRAVAGFRDISAIPSNAIIKGFTVRVKIATSAAGSLNVRMRTSLNGPASDYESVTFSSGNSPIVYSLDTSSLTWADIETALAETLATYPGVDIAADSTRYYWYFYGTELDVTYDIPHIFNLILPRG